MTSVATTIEARARQLGITRICHFTPSRNLVHIAADQQGILSTARLSREERLAFTATDLARLDGHPGHICCSVQYPNAWYLSKAMAKDPIFRDWVVLCIKPDYLWAPDTLVCARNAAAGYGRQLGKGLAAFDALFAPSVRGAYNMVRRRTPNHLCCCPTDDQAEVLVADRIAHQDIISIAVASREQAQREAMRLKLLGKSNAFRFIIAPYLFDKYKLSQAIRSGNRVQEEDWVEAGTSN
jgi:ssDNA thymidine ADP-ribosyltransferase DarT-like protein